jgi:hypothetical protein
MVDMQARAGDAGIARSGEAAVKGISTLIAEAVRDADDRRVAELDRILRHVETMMELSSGSPRERAN